MSACCEGRGSIQANTSKRSSRVLMCPKLTIRMAASEQQSLSSDEEGLRPKAHPMSKTSRQVIYEETMCNVTVDNGFIR